MEKRTVLVVEDNPDNLDLIRYLMETAGYQVYTAEDGRQALEQAQQRRPDFMLLDLTIPEIDGWDLARQLKAGADTAHIFIIALTGHAMPGDRKRALESGCDAYVTKPLDTPNFVHQVETLLSKA
ncbi:MAG: response regulator [Chloroflexi bacterium]|nr:response regulator [Anaerolineaceae bacterium]NMB87539.1 response regulator [Chloroflexota bacterium]